MPPGNAAIAQPPPRIHSRSGWRGDVRRDPRHVVGARVDLGEVAAGPLQPALDDVDVGVDEARGHQPAGDVDHLGAGSGVAVDRSHGDDPTVLDQHAAGAPVTVAVEDPRRR